jgi:hypothetical protein
MLASVWIRRKEGPKAILGRKSVARWAVSIPTARIFILVLLERLQFGEHQPREFAGTARGRHSDSTMTSPVLTRYVK